MTTENRADQSERTFATARDKANAHGITLTNPSDGCYQLRHRVHGWIINMYPRRSGSSPRMFHDPHHRGPYLKLPENWTIADAVNAAIEASDLELTQ